MFPYTCPYFKRKMPLYEAGVQKKFTLEEALEIGEIIGIDFSKIDLEQFRMGLEVELEHGTRFPQANVTNDDPVLTGKIAYAHLLELPDYYTRLAEMEAKARDYYVSED